MDNNLAFKLKRRRFVVETLHLDVEGGTSERKTTTTKSKSKQQQRQGRAAAGTEEQPLLPPSPAVQRGAESDTASPRRARVRFGDQVGNGLTDGVDDVPRQKKQGGIKIRHDKPELYDF
jgi:elongator complex protein 4